MSLTLRANEYSPDCPEAKVENSVVLYIRLPRAMSLFAPCGAMMPKEPDESGLPTMNTGYQNGNIK
jgi:hypothetical protein